MNPIEERIKRLERMMHLLTTLVLVAFFSNVIAGCAVARNPQNNYERWHEALPMLPDDAPAPETQDADEVDVQP